MSIPSDVLLSASDLTHQQQQQQQSFWESTFDLESGRVSDDLFTNMHMDPLVLPTCSSRSSSPCHDSEGICLAPLSSSSQFSSVCGDDLEGFHTDKQDAPRHAFQPQPTSRDNTSIDTRRRLPASSARGNKLNTYSTDCGSDDGRSTIANRNAINAKLNRERIKAERIKLETEVKLLREELAESRRSQSLMKQQLGAATNEIQQLQAILKASPHVGKLLAHMSGLTMSFNSAVVDSAKPSSESVQKRLAHENDDPAEDVIPSKRPRRGVANTQPPLTGNTTASTPFLTIPLQFNLQFVQRS